MSPELQSRLVPVAVSYSLRLNNRRHLSALRCPHILLGARHLCIGTYQIRCVWQFELDATVLIGDLVTHQDMEWCVGIVVQTSDFR